MRNWVATALLIAALLPFAALADSASETSLEWGWVRSSSGASSWYVTRGKATLHVGKGIVDAELFDHSDPTFRRASFSGTVSGNTYTVRVHIDGTDKHPFTATGRLRRLCWSDGGGREVLILSNGLESISLSRELTRGENCEPAA